jgi:hypothetical protein
MSDRALAKLPDISTATLPAVYERAKAALSTCERVDECKDWADKAVAIASYARQADDRTLLNHAVRIQARAVRRCGELLETYQAKGARTDREPKGDASPKWTQRRAAEAAGLSPDQEKQAVRVASVPAREFEAAIESNDPPTVTELAKRGTDKRPAKAPPTDFATATDALGYLRALEAFARVHPPESVARGVRAYERHKVIGTVIAVAIWVKRFEKALG